MRYWDYVKKQCYLMILWIASYGVVHYYFYKEFFPDIAPETLIGILLGGLLIGPLLIYLWQDKTTKS